jgi:hypothetical protein
MVTQPPQIITIRNTKVVDFNIRVSTWSHLSVICPLQKTYSYVQEKHSVSTRKFIESYLLFLHLLPTKFMHYCGRAWAGGTFLRREKKQFLQPTCSECLSDDGGGDESAEYRIGWGLSNS